LKNIILKNKILYLLLIILAIGCSNNSIIPQAEPFENTLISIKNNSTNLFKNSFSERVHNEDNDSLTWNERLKVAESRMELEFGELNPNDFSYEFEEKESILIVTHKTNEPFRMKVVMENGDWKLDEH
jgi:hypothetical protein